MSNVGVSQSVYRQDVEEMARERMERMEKPLIGWDVIDLALKLGLLWFVVGAATYGWWAPLLAKLTSGM